MFIFQLLAGDDIHPQAQMHAVEIVFHLKEWIDFEEDTVFDIACRGKPVVLETRVHTNLLRAFLRAPPHIGIAEAIVQTQEVFL